MGSPSGYNKRREMDVMKLCESLRHVQRIETIVPLLWFTGGVLQVDVRLESRVGE